jgi:hypothetical protein
LAIFRRVGGLSAGGVIQKNIPTEGWKVRPAADAKLFRQVLFISRAVQVMGVGVDNGELHGQTSKISAAVFEP